MGELVSFFGAAGNERPTFRLNLSRLEKITLLVKPQDREERVHLTLFHLDEDGNESETTFKSQTVVEALKKAGMFQESCGAKFVTPEQTDERKNGSSEEQRPRESALEKTLADGWQTYRYDSKDLRTVWISSNYGDLTFHQAIIEYMKDANTKVSKTFRGSGFGELLTKTHEFIASTCAATSN